ncbi:hypothetical protein B0T10DRAFT_488212 [Thelonectria olida]|uniref:C2H2-type domain-containing protein n=1 Tax=Thelonectria olida TaxID=1576542 RepID=A0A9P8W2G8_9HYPO|nr:hypothetical protein B0T10DRAFT_488212 [Thelonectria olida]
MRLLSVDNSGRLTLTRDLIDDIPAYAILSHTWGPDNEELTFQDVVEGRGKDKNGYRKIEFCGTQAASDGLRHFWVDSCCIDKTNNTELSQAINSMFRWYSGASKCYVYLSDVSNTGPSSWEELLPRSRWFTRGWTLQELVAPRVVEFFSSEGRLLGSKASLERQIQEITGIHTAALRCTPLSDFTPKERMLWAKGRMTKLEEDRAYSMLGIFEVHMPLIYGEGIRNAFIRLEDAVDRKQAFDSGLRQVTGNDSSLYQLYIGSEGKPNNTTAEQTQSQAKALNGVEHTNSQAKKLSEAEQACLRSLWFPSMDHRRLSLHNPVEETCSWLFEHKLYQDWFSGDVRGCCGNLLWLKGKPGVGKSVIMKEAFRRTSIGLDKSRYWTAAFFFNARGDELEQSTLGLFRSLLYQLLPRYPEHLQRLYKMREERMFDDPWREVELQDMFLSMFSDSSEQMTYLFIDALDECGLRSARSQVSFWNRIVELTGNNLRVCVSRRHFPTIGTGRSPSITMENNNGHGIARYVDRRLQFGMITAAPERETLRDNLLAKSSGIFLWVSLMLDDILAKWDDGKGIRYLIKQLDVVPEDLAALFSYMISSISADKKQLALRLFQWAILAVKPLRLHEWHHIMAFIAEPTPSSLWEWRQSDNFTETDEQLEKMIKSVSRGLVEVKTVIDEPRRENLDFMSVLAGAGSLDLERGESRVVQVIHESVREFFLRRAGFSILDIGPESDLIGRGHLFIIYTCLSYIDITELDALVRARRAASEGERHRLREVTRPETTPDRILNPSAGYQDKAQNHQQAVADDEIATSIDILRWLESLSTDSTTFNRIALDSSPCNTSTNPSIAGTSQVLEDYPALLSYATTQLFAHAKLAQATWEDPAHIIYRLLRPPTYGHLIALNETVTTWDRWVALNEEVPPGTNLVAYAESQNLSSWVSCVLGGSNSHEPLHRMDLPRLPSEPSEGYLGRGRRQTQDSSNGSPWDTTHQQRATSVASFGSAGSHANSIDEPVLSKQSPTASARPIDTGAAVGTYTCTYYGCTLRFETPARLQKHKREGHRLKQATNNDSRPELNVGTPAGPHRCDRINPSTGKPCNTIFSRPYDLTRHEDTIHHIRKQKVRCDFCTEEKTFSRADALTRHYRVCHPDVEYPGKHRRRRT